jgi:hypothetical protein
MMTRQSSARLLAAESAILAGYFDAMARNERERARKPEVTGSNGQSG